MEIIDSDGDAIEKVEVYTDIKLLCLLPCNMVVGQITFPVTLRSLVVVLPERIAVTSLIHIFVEVTVARSHIRAYYTVGCTYLEMLHGFTEYIPEPLLLRHHIAHTHGREETVSVVCTETVGAVVGGVEVDEVFTCILVAEFCRNTREFGRHLGVILLIGVALPIV